MVYTPTPGLSLGSDESLELPIVDPGKEEECAKKRAFEIGSLNYLC